MSSAGKRLDLRFGAFACSVQGFDDPVQPVQQVLRAIQHLLEESPDLAETAINFDAESIEQLVGEVARRAELDEDSVEIVPGLVIIHHAGGGDLAGRGDEAAGAWGVGEDTGATDYVNLFGMSGGEDAGEAEADAPEPGADEPAEELEARLRRMSDEAPAGGGADYGWDDAADEGEPAPAGDHILRPGAARDDARDDDSWGDDGPGDEGWGEDAGEAEPVNVFAGAGDNDGGDAGSDVTNLFAAGSADDDEDDNDDNALVLGQPRLQEADAAGAAAGDGEAGQEEADEGYTAAAIAERAGATRVPDLMVSAAAFMVLIRGQGQFTRRDVLDVFEAIPGDHEKTLEAQIKGFGKAVRNGQLVMIEDGVFGLARKELDRFQNLL